MAILSKGINFSTGEQVTADKLDALVDSAAFVGGAVDNSSTQLSGGAIIVKDSGITASKIASNAVTTIKITDANVTPAKLSAGAPTWDSATTTIAASLDFAAISSTATAGTYGRSGTTVTITMAGHGMSTGMVAALTFSGGTGGAATNGSYPITYVSSSQFTIIDPTSGTITGSPACSRAAYYGNSTVRGSQTVAGNLSVTKDLSVSGSVSIGGTTVRQLTSGTAQNSTSGSAIDFTGIPSWAKRVTVMLDGVSTNGTTVPLLQVGAGSVTTSGYVANVGSIGSSDNATSGFPTALGFPSSGYGGTNGATYTGIIFLINLSGNTWICSGTLYPSGASSSSIAGSIALSGSLDRIRLTTITGTTVGSGTFDAGQINIMYEG